MHPALFKLTFHRVQRGHRQAIIDHANAGQAAGDSEVDLQDFRDRLPELLQSDFRLNNSDLAVQIDFRALLEDWKVTAEQVASTR